MALLSQHTIQNEFDRLEYSASVSSHNIDWLDYYRNKFQPREMAVKITFDSHWQRRDFVAKDGMKILLLTITGHRNTGRKEGDMPHKYKHNGQSAVRAKDLHRRERTVNADHERYDVGQWGDCNGNGRLRHHQTHALRHVQFHGCTTPSSQHYKRIIDTDTWNNCNVITPSAWYNNLVSF